MVYVVLDLEPRASSMLDEHSPADAGGGGVVAVWECWGWNPGALAPLHSPSLAGPRQQLSH